MISSAKLAQIYTSHRETILKYLTNTLNQPITQAEDTYHNAIIKFWHRYDPKRGKPLPLLVEICKNTTYNHSCRASKISEIHQQIAQSTPENPCVLEEYIKQDTMAKIRTFFLRITKGRAHTICRLWLDGYSKSDISQVSGISKGVIYRILHDCILSVSKHRESLQ
jgi:RNA polymerase sigma factor (sigma-70 family)